jgi:hypothetical protein
MNLTLIAALALLAGWVVLAFVVAIPQGYVHVLYPAGVVLLVRRVLVGAPRFRS